MDEALGGFLYSYRVPEDHAMMISWYNRVCDIGELPNWEQLDALEDLEAEVRAAKAQYRPARRLILSTLLLPLVKKVGEAAMRDRANLVCAEAALAAERFRLAHKRWPKSLDELKPAFLPVLPVDPYTGDPLLYARKADGVVVYSVGQDLQDDGGDIIRHNKCANWDVGIRLYDADKRNLPPEPPEDIDP